MLCKINQICVIGVIIIIIATTALWLFYPYQQLVLLEKTQPNALQVLSADEELIAWRVGGDEHWRLPITVADVSPHLISATIAAEDQRFFSHLGLDLWALARAVWQNVTNARRVSGASTLTMQTARLLNPRPRTYHAKILEIVTAFQLERVYDKQAILTAYFNLAPYGGNVIGAQAAALRYFGKAAKHLTLGEAALIAGIPQRPSFFNPRKNLDAALARREFIFTRMRILNLASDEQITRARNEKIILSPPTAPPHNIVGFADWLLKIYPDGGTKYTTINSPIQQLAQKVVAEMSPSNLGIDGLAMAVIDVTNSALVALVSNNNANNAQSGQINGALIWRQPGSLLKPFIFATAYQQGSITPSSFLQDQTTEWAEYRPENMDKKFLGTLSAQSALAQSRNLPAVNLLSQIGVDNFREVLQKMNLRVNDKVGLSLALGTPEMRLLDLANAYATLARHGIYQSLRILRDEKLSDELRVFSAPAAWLTLSSLSPEKDAPKIAWKTGTSWQHRDAWAMAMSPRYVVAVWSGCWTGNSNERLVGGEISLPPALTMLKHLDKNETWEKPLGVQTRKICATSGLIATTACPTTQDEYYIIGVSKEKLCPQHFGANNTDNAATKTQNENSASAENFTLISPRQNAQYFISAETPTLPLQAISEQNINWYLNGEKIATTKPHEIYPWTMQSGTHEIIAVDQHGNAKKITFSVSILRKEKR